MKVDNSVKITGLVVVGVLLVAWMVVSLISSFSPYETISVDGDATVNVVPDVAVIYLIVETLDDSADVAKDANAEIVSEVKVALLDAGVGEDEIETSGFSVSESYDWSDGDREFVGYEATHSIIVEVDADEDLIGSVVDAAVEAGAMLSYVSFSLSPELENEVKAEAMGLAAEDARVKAEAVADGLGMSLGKVVSISASDFSYGVLRAYGVSVDMIEDEDGAVSSKAETDIEVGEEEVSASVSVTYKIK